MKTIYFDCETKSSKELSEVGVINYVNTEESEILCIGYSYDLNTPSEIWIPALKEDPPKAFLNPDEYLFYAFNLGFDKTVIDTLGKPYGIKPIPINNCVDVRALTCRYGLPASLEKAGDALGIKVLKYKAGKALLKKITMPPFVFSHHEFLEFCKYCKQDVNLMCDIIKALPADKLSAEEHKNWVSTYTVNSTGMGVDVYTMRRIYTILDRYIEDVAKEVPIITLNEIQTIGQRDKIIEWCRTQGVIIPDFTRHTVSQFLEKEDLPNLVRELFKIKILIGMPSTKRYKKMLLRNYKGRIYHNFIYYGSHTGRETSYDVQMHNLPKGQLKSAEEIETELKKFYDLSILDELPVQAAKNLIRPMVVAHGRHKLAVLDYSAIEHVLLLWVAKEEEGLNNLKKGGDNYVDFAAKFNGIAQSEVTKEQRNFGKTAILGCGYMMGGPRLYDMCYQFGIKTTLPNCYKAVELFRSMYSRVQDLWYSLKSCALNALCNPSNPYEVNGCVFTYLADRNNKPWLALKLPSGRVMYYNDPQIGGEDYGPVFTYMGVHPTTKKFVRLEAGPNKIIENIVQALGRDILMDGRRKIMKEYPLIASIHDENVIEVPDNSHTHWEYIKQLMETAPLWCHDLPLTVSGYCEKRYRKD